MREYLEGPSQTQSKDCFKDNFNNVYCMKCGLFYVQAGNIRQKESYLHGVLHGWESLALFTLLCKGSHKVSVLNM
jgi:hypothetical protein